MESYLTAGMKTGFVCVKDERKKNLKGSFLTLTHMTNRWEV